MATNKDKDKNDSEDAWSGARAVWDAMHPGEKIVTTTTSSTDVIDIINNNDKDKPKTPATTTTTPKVSLKPPPAPPSSPITVPSTLNNFKALPTTPNGQSSTLNNFDAKPPRVPLAPPSSPITVPSTINNFEAIPTIPPTPVVTDTTIDSGTKTGNELDYYTTNKITFNTDPGGNDTEDIEFQDIVLQEIGGRELLILERHDMVDGINQKYEPIKNLSKYALEYSPTNIDPYPNTVVDFFFGLIFEINVYIPSLEDLLEIGQTAVAYFDEVTNSIVIHVKDLLDNHFVEVEFVSFDEVIDDTICI